MTGSEQADRVLQTVTRGRASAWLAAYENAVGLSAVRLAQSKVIAAESQFLQAQEERRKMQNDISEVQRKLRSISAELEKVHRGEERYLTLLTEEHQIIKEDNHIQEKLNQFEKEERAKFAVLSSAVRESHEKERARAERTKYWSVIGSVIGAAIGIIGTSINNYLRMRELRGIVKDSAEGGVELRSLVSTLSEAMKAQQEKVQTFMSDLKVLTGTPKSDETIQLHTLKTNQLEADGVHYTKDLKKQTSEILSIIQKQEKNVAEEMKAIKEIIAVGKATDDTGNVVYVGPKMQDLLNDTEKNIETKLKLNALWTACFIYGGLALAVPIIYNMFKVS